MSNDARNDSDSSTATLASVTYGRIRKDIISGDLQPGEKLRMAQMCQRYDVGLSPMREALSRLGKEGMVLQSDRRGFFVAEVSNDELKELIRSRCLLYEVALRESILNGDAAWEENIVVLFHRLERARTSPSSANDTEQWDALHRQFHTALIAACGSRWLISYCEQLFDQAQRYRSLSRTMPGKRDVDAEHKAIMEATLARDIPKAVALLCSHIEKTGALASVNPSNPEHAAFMSDT